jgi:hypothetical protein
VSASGVSDAQSVSRVAEAHDSRKIAKRRHSERGLSAKNLSSDFGVHQEGSIARKTSDRESSFASFRMTTARLFQQTVPPLHSGFSL